jgi:hypothetical protein
MKMQVAEEAANENLQMKIKPEREGINLAVAPPLLSSAAPLRSSSPKRLIQPISRSSNN